MELVTLALSRARRAQRTRGQEKRERGDLAGGDGRIGRRELVQEPSGGEDEVILVISAREPFLAFQVARVDGNDARVVFQGPSDALGCAHGSFGVQEVVGAGGKGDPFPVGGEGGHVCGERVEEGLGLYGGAGLPFFEGVPCGLDGTYDAEFEGCAVLLRHDEGFLE